jgi:type I restriction enzyme, S subunit
MTSSRASPTSSSASTPLQRHHDHHAADDDHHHDDGGSLASAIRDASEPLMDAPDRLASLRVNPDWAKLPLFGRSKWQRVRFGDMVRVLKEEVDPTSGEVDRYVAGEHMDSENIHIRRWGTVGDGYLGPAFHRRFRKGQVLYGSRRTYLKKVAVAEWDGVTANTTFVLETMPDRMLQDLLPWLMLSERFTTHSIQESKGSTNPYINWPDIAKLELSIPPLEVQGKLAGVFRHIEEARRKWTAAAESAECLIRTFVSEFLSSNPKREKCSALLDLSSGKAKPAHIASTPSSDNDVPVYGGNGVIGYTDIPLLKESAVIVGRVGEYCGCVHLSDRPSWVTDNAIVVKARDSRLSKEFVYWMLTAANLNSMKKVAGQPLISQSTIQDVQIPVPDVSSQEAFVRRCDLLVASLADVRKQDFALSSFRQALAFVCFS